MKSAIRRALPLVLVFALVVVAAFGAGVGYAQEERKSITGTWSIKGWNAGKEKIGAPDYEGSVEVEKKHAKGCYELTWKIGQTETLGIGVYDEKSGVLGAAYVLKGKPGVVLYRPDGTGKLEGLWAVKGGLEKPPGFEQWRR